MTAELTVNQRLALRALCDTYVPAIKVADDPTGFWARSASDLGVPEELARYLLDTVPEPLRGALLGLLDALAAAGLVAASQGQREKILASVAGSSAAAGRVRGRGDARAGGGLVAASQGQREKILASVAGSSPAAAQGLAFFEKR